MLGAKNLQGYKSVIEGALVAMGRDDVGVGDVVEQRDGVLAVTLSRGSHTHTVELAVEDLQRADRARTAVTRAIFDLSKEVEQETMRAAERAARK